MGRAADIPIDAHLTEACASAHRAWHMDLCVCILWSVSGRSYAISRL